MKNIKYLFPVFIFCLGILNAQTFFNINPYPKTEPLKLTSQDTLKILAVMVEFQQDNDGNTFGNGKFGSIYSQEYGNDILDPLPHDQNYFEQHLKFAENYYRKVSNGNLNLTYYVLPEIITVSKIMREYSPGIESNDFTPIGEFAEEVWQLTDESYPEIDFGTYDLFTIFHAGVGREIPTPGSLGLERDLPSVYLSPNALEEIFGEGFSGFSVDDGSFQINNTMIMPCTENREIESFSEIYLQEFSINGLIVSSIASHLGLPDLFNTETGRSTIGRFGLMDGQAIFAYGGLFPPEPSPWEKMYLGWIEPVELNIIDQNVSLKAHEIARKSITNEISLVKIPINSTEYYLVENRKRDANNDGVTLTYMLDGAEQTITFQKDLRAFSPYDIDTVKGVVTDVDEFDWAVPGFEEEQTFDDPFEDIGLVIWHIDEKVINENLSSNTINNDKERRGIKVVEADGIFDIGEEFINIFGETELGEGTKQDTWYQSNPSRLYENIFNYNSDPPAVTNLGAGSLIEINEISSISNEMSFQLSFKNNTITKLVQTKLDLEQQVKNIYALENIIAVHAGNNISLYDDNGNFLFTINDLSSVKPAVFERNGSNYFIGASGNLLKVAVMTGEDINSVSLYELPVEQTVTAPVILSDAQALSDIILLGTENGRILKYEFDENKEDKLRLLESFDAFDNLPVKQVVYNYTNQNVFAIAGNYYWNSISGEVISFQNNLKKIVVSRSNDINIPVDHAVVLDEDNNISVLANGEINTTFSVSKSETVDDILLADLKSDGNTYIVYSYGNVVDARNLNGHRADYFPLKLEEADKDFSAKLNLAADLNSDRCDDILIFDEQGVIYAVDGKAGDVNTGFPISSGSESIVHPVIYNSNQLRLSLVTAENEILAWNLGTQSERNGWNSEFANNYNNALFSISAGENVIDEYFPKDMAYNWPNPVYEGETYIRFYVSQDSDVDVKIFDISGDLVDELAYNASGGLNNEIPWNINDIQSGIYFAHLKVNSSEGNSDSKIIKIAVIK